VLYKYRYFWAAVRKTVRPVLSNRCSVCPVCDVGVLWPNGWMDQDATWYSDRPQPRRHCVRWGPSCLPKKGNRSPQFSAHVYYGQTAGWIKMPLGTEIGLGPGDIVLDWDPAPLPAKKGHSSPHFLAQVRLYPSAFVICALKNYLLTYLVWPNGRPSQQLLSSCYATGGIS